MVRRIWRVIKVVIMGLIRDHNFSVLSTPKLNTEAYRSGHNGTDSKSVVPHGTVGSNPTASANAAYARTKISRKEFLAAFFHSFLLYSLKILLQ